MDACLVMEESYTSGINGNYDMGVMFSQQEMALTGMKHLLVLHMVGYSSASKISLHSVLGGLVAIIL